MIPASQLESRDRGDSFLNRTAAGLENSNFAACFLNMTSDGVVLVNSTGVIVECNGAMSEMLACSSEDLIGRSLERLHPSSQYFRVSRMLETLEDSVGGGLKETRLLQGDGGTLFVELRGQAWRQGGSLYYCLPPFT